jgi:TolB-like protein
MVHLLIVLGLVLAASPAAARTIAVAYFDNNTGRAELEPLRKGLADMLITDLGHIASLQIVERDKLNQVLGELKLSTSKFIDPKTAQKLGKGLAAEYIMTGGYVLAADTLRIDVRVLEVATGKVVASEKVEGKQDEFFALEKDLVDILVNTLDVKLSSGERGKLRANATQSFDAWQKYSAGLDAKDRGDAALARRLFQAALDADPSYRAAKTATERLKVIFARSDAAKAAEIDKVWRSLDPKAPDFAHKVDKLLSELTRNTADELRQKIALLSFLAERELTPTLPGGFSRIPLEVNAMLWVFDSAPDAEALLPPVCEYLISRFPRDQSAPQQCKLLLHILELHAKEDPARRRRAWEDKRNTATLDWDVAQSAVRPEMIKLFRLYGQKVKRP